MYTEFYVWPYLLMGELYIIYTTALDNDNYGEKLKGLQMFIFYISIYVSWWKVLP